MLGHTLPEAEWHFLLFQWVSVISTGPWHPLCCCLAAPPSSTLLCAHGRCQLLGLLRIAQCLKQWGSLRSAHPKKQIDNQRDCVNSVFQNMMNGEVKHLKTEEPHIRLLSFTFFAPCNNHFHLYLLLHSMKRSWSSLPCQTPDSRQETKYRYRLSPGPKA